MTVEAEMSPSGVSDGTPCVVGSRSGWWWWCSLVLVGAGHRDDGVVARVPGAAAGPRAGEHRQRR